MAFRLSKGQVESCKFLIYSSQGKRTGAARAWGVRKHIANKSLEDQFGIGARNTLSDRLRVLGVNL